MEQLPITPSSLFYRICFLKWHVLRVNFGESNNITCIFVKTSPTNHRIQTLTSVSRELPRVSVLWPRRRLRKPGAFLRLVVGSGERFVFLGIRGRLVERRLDDNPKTHQITRISVNLYTWREVFFFLIILVFTNIKSWSRDNDDNYR